MDAKRDSQPAPSPPAGQPPAWVRGLFSVIAIAAVLCTGFVATYGLVAKPRPIPAALSLETTTVDLCPAADDGYLTGTLYGSLERAIDWRGPTLECDGMSRPGSSGIRLVFTGPGETPLVIVLGIEGRMHELASTERRANVTIIVESAGQIFSAGGMDRCWTTVDSVEALDDPGGMTFQVVGEVYCSGSLPSLSDAGSVTLRDFRYSGRLVLDAS